MVAPPVAPAARIALLMNLKNHIGSIVFLVAAGASAIYGAVLERQSGRFGDRDAAESRAFSSFDRAALTGIEIERGAEKLVLTREHAADPLRMTSPANSATDATSVDQLVSALELATVVRRVPDPPPVASAPRAKGALHFGGKVVHFTLGAPAPVPEGAAYLEVEGAGTVVVGRELASELLRPFDAYRDRVLVPIAVADVARFEVAGPEGALALDRLDDVSFRVAGGGRASREITDRWLSALPELRAVSFVAPDVAKRGPLQRTLTVKSRDGAVTTLRFGGPCPDDREDVIALVDGASPVAACVPRVIASAFQVTPALATDTRVFFARPDEAAELAIESPDGGAAISLARVGSGFHERRPESRDLDADENEAASTLLGRVLAVTGTPVAAPAAPPAPALKVTLGRAGGDAQEKVDIVDAASGALAHRAADGAWLAITPAARKAFDPPPGGVRAPALLPRSFSADAASRLVVKCGAWSETLVRTDGTFAFEAPRGVLADQSRVQELLELFAKTRGRDVVSAAALPHGKDACTVTIAWSADGGATTASFAVQRLPEDAGADVVAQREGEREALVVDAALERSVSEPLVDRGALAWSADGAERATVVRKGGARVEVDPSRLALALRDLRAARVDRLGPPSPEEAASPTLVEIRVGGEGAAPVVYRVARGKTPGELLVRRSDVDATFRVPDDALPPDVR